MVSAVVIGASLAPSRTADAWSNGGYSWDPLDPDYGTHDWIAEAALAIQTRDASFLTGDNLVRFLLGTEAPDNDEYIGDHDEHHVYYYATGAVQDDAAGLRAQDMYDLALLADLEDRPADTAYYLGAMAHYISDVGVFGHTMGAVTVWGYEEHHTDYEEEFESIIDSLERPTDMTLSNMSAYDAALGLAKDITFGTGSIKANTWMDDNYEWSDSVFVASAMASLDAAVYSVAATIEHFLWEVGAPASDDTMDGAEATDDLGGNSALYFGAVAAVVVAAIIYLTRKIS
jgi:hypothetical protein